MDNKYQIICDWSDNLANENEELNSSSNPKNKIINKTYHKFRNIYQNSPDLHRTINLDGIIVDCNRSYFEKLGYNKDEVIGKSIFEHVADKSFEVLGESVEEWKKNKLVKNKEIWLRRKDGSVFPTLLSATDVLDEEGKLIGSNTVIRDISDIYNYKQKQIEYEKKIAELIDENKKQKKQKNEFIEMLGNDLKHAVFQIKSETRDLLSCNNSEINDAVKIEKIKIKADSILKMLTDVSLIHKIENNELSLQRVNCDLSTIIEKLVVMCNKARDSNYIIVSNLQKNLECYVDKEKTEYVLYQILVNAIDYSQQEQNTIYVNSSYYDVKYAKIVVKDSGIGVRKENLEKFFQKFYQIDTSCLRKYSGAGLGLSICKEIIRSHEGKIWAESKGSNAGTEIHILLPLATNEKMILRKIE